MTGLKVYFWHGEHHSSTYAGGWVVATWAAAVSSLGELRRLCSAHGVKYPGKPYLSKPGRAEWDAAMSEPGVLLLRNDEPTGSQTGDWQVHRPEP